MSDGDNPIQAQIDSEAAGLQLTYERLVAAESQLVADWQIVLQHLPTPAQPTPPSPDWSGLDAARGRIDQYVAGLVAAVEAAPATSAPGASSSGSSGGTSTPTPAPGDTTGAASDPSTPAPGSVSGDTGSGSPPAVPAAGG